MYPTARVPAAERSGRLLRHPLPQLCLQVPNPTAPAPRVRLAPLRAQLPAELAVSEVSLPTVSNIVFRVHLNVKFDMRRIFLAFGHAEYHPANFAVITIRDDNVTCSVFRPGKMVVTGGKTIMATKANAHRYRILVEQIPQPVALIRPPNAIPGAGHPKISKISKISNNTLFQAARADLRKQLPHFAGFGLRVPQPYTCFDRARAVNIVADGDLGTAPLSLANLYKEYHEVVTWTPATFTGLRFPVTREFILRHPRLARTLKHPCVVIIFHTGRDNIVGAKSVEDVHAVHRFMCDLVKDFRATNFPSTRSEIYEYSCREHQRVVDEMAEAWREQHGGRKRKGRSNGGSTRSASSAGGARGKVADEVDQGRPTKRQATTRTMQEASTQSTTAPALLTPAPAPGAARGLNAHEEQALRDLLGV